MLTKPGPGRGCGSREHLGPDDWLEGCGEQIYRLLICAIRFFLSRPPLAKLEADRFRPVSYRNPESLIVRGRSCGPLEDHGHGVAAGASAGTVADRYFAPNWWSRAVDASTELHNSLSAVCSNHGEHAVARAGVGEIGNTPPGLTVDGDCYFVCVAHDQPPQLRAPVPQAVLTLLLLEVLFELVNAENKLQSLSGHKALAGGRPSGA